jgi:hypothetical protein
MTWILATNSLLTTIFTGYSSTICASFYSILDFIFMTQRHLLAWHRLDQHDQSSCCSLVPTNMIHTAVHIHSHEPLYKCKMSKDVQMKIANRCYCDKYAQGSTKLSQSSPFNCNCHCWKNNQAEHVSTMSQLCIIHMFLCFIPKSSVSHSYDCFRALLDLSGKIS